MDIVDTVISIKNAERFYGLYGRLPRRCWSNNSQYIFLSTPQQNNIRSYIVDISKILERFSFLRNLLFVIIVDKWMNTSFIETKTVTEILNDKTSLTVLDVKNDIIAFSQTSLLEPSVLTVGRFNQEAIISGNITRSQISVSTMVPGSENLTYEPSEYNYDNSDEISK